MVSQLSRLVPFTLPAGSTLLLAVATYRTPDGSIHSTCDSNPGDNDALTGAEMLDVAVLLQRAAKVVANQALLCGDAENSPRNDLRNINLSVLSFVTLGQQRKNCCGK